MTPTHPTRMSRKAPTFNSGRLAKASKQSKFAQKQALKRKQRSQKAARIAKGHFKKKPKKTQLEAEEIKARKSRVLGFGNLL